MGLGNGLTSDEPALNGEGDGRLKLKLAAPVVSSKTRKVLVVSDNVGDVLKNLTVVLLAYMHSQELGKKSSGPLSPVLPTTGLIISAYLLWTYEFIWWCDLFFSQTGCYKSECCYLWKFSPRVLISFSLDLPRALVRKGYGTRVTSYVDESVVTDINPDNKDIYIKEGSRVCIMGVVQRNDNVLMIVHPSEPISTGCQSASG
uniref:Uncharacterized protein n=1 Tax=Oryza nivara TaxID=4536 RepID=A0A0E0I8N1_ORYNI